MASTALPSWLRTVEGVGLGLTSGLKRVGSGLQGLWKREIHLRTALLAALGLSAVGFLAQDISWYYLTLPQEMRGTHSASLSLYLLSAIIRVYRKIRAMDGLSAQPIRKFVEDQPEELYARSFLAAADVPIRRAPRPELLHQGIPHRQVPQVIDPILEEQLKSVLRSFAQSHPSLTLTPSRVEPNALALFLPSPPPQQPQTHPDLAPSSPTSFSTPYEFVHVHGGESSLHLILAPLDAALAVERGWAVRFPLAGAGLTGGLYHPEGRVLVYAPRDETEVEVIKRLVRAGWEWFQIGKGE